MPSLETGAFRANTMTPFGSTTMSNINSIGNNSSVQRVLSQPIHKQVPTAAAKTPTTDRLELSGMSHLFQTLKNNDIRTDMVADIKSRIEAGTYEDGAKLDIAVDRLLDDLLK